MAFYPALLSAVSASLNDEEKKHRGPRIDASAIAWDLLAVCTFRTACLIDTAFLSDAQVRRMVARLADVEQASDLLALTMPDVDGLLFFANRTRLLRRLRSGTLPILVDVSPGRGSPSIMRDGDSAPLERTLYDYAAKLAELLDHFGWSPCSLELPQPRPRTLMPAVTALLAGYPIAYVTSSETGDTCLARVPLHLVRVSASIAQGEPRHVFSFTFPAADGDGGDEMMRRVGQWDEELRTMAAEGVELSIERSTVVHDQVVM